MIAFAPYPIPVVVEENKEGYLLYIQSSEQFENDVWTIVLCDGGIIKHYTTNQVKIYQNLTFGIIKK